MKVLFSNANASMAVVFLLISLVLSACYTIPDSKKYPNMVANVDPIPTGTIQVQIDKAFMTGLQKRAVETVFEPRENAVYLQFTYQSVFYRQYWSQDARAAFVEAVKRYKQDFNDRALIKRGKQRAYGKVRGKTVFSSLQMSISERYTSEPQIDLGYVFKRNNPYFQVLMLKAKADVSTNDKASLYSLRIPFYFTMAQAEELAAIFDQDWLMRLLGEKGDDGMYRVERDEYEAREKAGSKGGFSAWFDNLKDSAADTVDSFRGGSSGPAEGDSYNTPAPAASGPPPEPVRDSVPETPAELQQDVPELSPPEPPPVEESIE
ncbi:MAG: hypothetical protein LBE10_06305 [Treponema sp.]|jgi:hypothetical protein|nr:hypothetical protein [Treponema sp.]